MIQIEPLKLTLETAVKNSSLAERESTLCVICGCEKFQLLDALRAPVAGCHLGICTTCGHIQWAVRYTGIERFRAGDTDIPSLAESCAKRDQAERMFADWRWKASSVLFVDCEEGAVAKAFGEPICVEGRKGMRAYSEHYHGLTVAPEFVDDGRKYDIVVLNGTLSRSLDPVAVLKKAKGMLSPDGRIFVIDETIDRIDHPTPSAMFPLDRQHAFTADGMALLFNRCGLLQVCGLGMMGFTAVLSACDAQEPTAGLDVFRAKASEAIDRIKTAFDAKAIADNYTGDNTQLHGGLLRAIEAVPIFPEAVSKYASSLEAQDAVDWIEGHIERVGGGVPEFVVTLAVILYKMQEYERAEEKFLLAETMQGKGYFTMSHRVHLRYMQDRTIDALALLAEMGKLYPHEVYVHEIARAICSNMI